MARGRPSKRKPRGRAFRAFERLVLGLGMAFVAFFVERRLLKAIKKGGVEPAPRTAAEGDESPADTVPEPSKGELG